MNLRSDHGLSAFDSGQWSTDPVPCPPEPALAAHVDRELDEARSGAVEAHLDRCPACAGAARRLERLSHLMRAWDAEGPAVAPPSRLASRILREVEGDSGLRRRQTRSSFRRARLQAVAAILAIALGAYLGSRSTDATSRGGDAVPAARGSWEAAAWKVGPILPDGDDARPRAPFSLAAPTVAPLGDAADSDGLALAAVRLAPREAPDAQPVLSDPSTKEAFARMASLHAAELRLGEPLEFRANGWAVPRSGVDEFDGVRRWEARWLDRARRAAESSTHDPSDAGVPLARLFPLPAEDRVDGFLESLTLADVPATRRSGGLSLRALPALPAPVGPAAAARPERAIDLAEAVRLGQVRLLEDARANPEVVVVQVRGLDVPVLVPAGELLSGGLVSRVVARGVWLPAGGDSYQARLSCRAVGPLSPSSRGAPGSPAATGLLAGPELRGALAAGEGADGIRAIVRAELRGAALDAPGSAPDLLRLYVSPDRPDRPDRPDQSDEADAGAAARRLVTRLGEDARGFVATDPSGRLQGAEVVGLSGPASRALLERLVAGYLTEARARSSADGSRPGVGADVVLRVLAGRPLRLSPLAPAAGAPKSLRVLVGDEPRTGVSFEAVVTESGAAVLSSGLVPDAR